MNIQRRMTHLALTATLLLSPALALAQGITGNVSKCPRPGCNVTARLHLNPPRDMASEQAALFIAITRLEGGQPDISAGGWYDGKTWRTTSTPVPAWTGRLTRRTANVRIPGGVCGLVASAGGPPGAYALFAGWGRIGSFGNMDGYRKKQDDMMKIVRELEANGHTDEAEEVRRMIGEYQATLGRLEQANAGDNAAFLDARQRGTYWQIASFDCTTTGGTR